jgi:Zn-dependent protease
VTPATPDATPAAQRPPGLWIRLVPVGRGGLYVDGLVALLLVYLLVDRGIPGGLGSKLGLLGVVLGSVLLHELGHAVMALARGLRVGGIFLHLVPFAYVERGEPADELRVALAGPAVNLVAGGILLAAFGTADFPWLRLHLWVLDPLWMAIGLNLLMGCVNLVPALPADGGRALRAFLMMRMAPASAYARTARVGTFVGVALFPVALLVWRWPDSGLLAVLGLFVIMVAWREARAGQRERRLERQSASGSSD